MRRFILPTAVASLILAGCATEERPSPSPAPRPVPARPRPPAPAAATSADYVARAASIDLFAIRSSELALTRATNPRVGDFARKMMRDHAGTSGQLSLAGRRLDLLPSAVLRPEHEAMMRELLATTTDFDRLYVQQQMRVHQQALALHNAFAARGSSPTLRPVAAAAAPIERRHLQELRGIK